MDYTAPCARDSPELKGPAVSPEPPLQPPRGERELIRRLRAELEAAPGTPHATSAVPFGDDLAPLGLSGSDLLWSVDMLMDGVDFDSASHSWESIGRKALAVNLSDCAAMGVEPVGALLAVALDDALTTEQALALARGAIRLGSSYNCPVLGGDTNSWRHPTVVSVSVAARPRPGTAPVRRDGARAGDRILLSGPLGGSILGRHLTFEPRVALGLSVAAQLRPHAMTDISDGLSTDLDHICEASGVGAVVFGPRLDAMIHADARALALRSGRMPREHALNDGEDFELIVVTPPDVSADECTRLGLHPLGEIAPGAGMRIREADGREIPLRPGGWEHFQ